MSHLIDPSNLPALRRHRDLLEILLVDRSLSTPYEQHFLSHQVGLGWQELKYSNVLELALVDKNTTPPEIIKLINQRADYESGHWPVDRQNWQTYVSDQKLEICCGTAPFIANRQIATSNVFPLDDRNGFLDRKLRVVSRFCRSPETWLEWAKIAYQSSYGYELCGDRLFIARENLLYTFVDFWNAQFADNRIDLRRQLSLQWRAILQNIATIISWNLFQMDGLSYTSPSNPEVSAKIVDWQTGETLDFPNLAKNKQKPHSDKNPSNIIPQDSVI